MIGSGIPINQSSAPRPKPMSASLDLNCTNNAQGVSQVPPGCDCRKPARKNFCGTKCIGPETRAPTSPRSFAGRGRLASSDARRVRGEALCSPKLAISDLIFATRESFTFLWHTASPLTRSLRCAAASTSPREERGEVRGTAKTCAAIAAALASIPARRGPICRHWRQPHRCSAGNQAARCRGPRQCAPHRKAG